MKFYNTVKKFGAYVAVPVAGLLSAGAALADGYTPYAWDVSNATAEISNLETPAATLVIAMLVIVAVIKGGKMFRRAI